jgi:hypothetical protein
MAEPALDEEALFDALDGLHAYDSGCVDSGIHDERLRQRVKEELARIAEDERTESQLVSRRFNTVLSKFLNKHFLGEEALAQGYGYEDMMKFLRWLSKEMDVPEVW